MFFTDWLFEQHWLEKVFVVPLDLSYCSLPKHERFFWKNH